ncbi:MAG: FAD-binding oxidoreductase [Gemmatimonadaceae bacterium]
MKTTDKSAERTSREPPVGAPQPAGSAPQQSTTHGRATARAWTIVRWVGRMGKRLALAMMVILLVTAIATGWGVSKVRVSRPAKPPTINDVTQLNPIVVAEVIAPTTVEEIVAAVKAHGGPISVGGGRYSMGGQTATPGALQIDMRRFNRVLAFDSVGRTITVQPGIRWRQIQERIDPANLSVKIMQTYSNFTVGGSLSVNVHGRYIGLGPLILSVRSLTLVLADGSLAEASPTANPELFYGAIGGYGGIGVIVEATLELADNVNVKRRREVLPVGQYAKYFASRIRDSADVVFHNGDIYPDDYATVSAVSYLRTAEPVTVPDRLIPQDRSYRLNRFVYSVISEWPFGKEIRQHVVEPLMYRGTVIEHRNYEASYDVADLEPSSREASTYVLQEYFVPVEHFDAFVPKMAAVFRKHDVNVINVSIRHALPDRGSLLAWAPREVFAFVVYYKQGTDTEARRAVGVWTREMIDSVLTVQGAYYLPYQPAATEAQFLSAYPRAPEFFALKQRMDPTSKFRNTLWDKYYLPRVEPAAAPVDAAVRARLDTANGYLRDEGQTFLTHPEWYIVYSSDEYAAWMKTRLPTDFPYLVSIGQFWVNYREARALTSHAYPLNGGYHAMLVVIGTSYSAELALKGLYENTIGRVSGWTAGHALSEEDHYAYQVAHDYGQFIHVYPWYKYPFAAKLRGLWTELPAWGPHAFRKYERKMFLSLEYGIKALYASVIGFGTAAAYGTEDDRMQLVATGWSDSLAAAYPVVQLRARLDSQHVLLAAPRYDLFRDLLLRFAGTGASVHLTEIAGNDDILLTGIAPAAWRSPTPSAQVVYSLPLPSDAARHRVAMRVRVPDLLAALGVLQAERGLTVDHIYDY